MYTKKQLSAINLDELHTELKRFTSSYFKSKLYILEIVLTIIVILCSIYVMQDGFSYLMTGLALWTTYYNLKRLIYRSIIIREIKSRN
jgi:hypothetical protein